MKIKVKELNSFCVALMICSRATTQLLNFPMSSIIVLLFAFILILLTSAKHLHNKNKLIVSAYICVFFVLTFCLCGRNSTTTEYLLYFGVFGLTAFFLPSRFDFRLVFRYVMLIGAVLLWSYVSIDFEAISANSGGEYENVAAVFMDISYKTLVFVITGIIMVVIEDKWYMKLMAGMISLPYMIISFVYGARGALLSVFVFALLFWLVLAKDQRTFWKRVTVSCLLCVFLWALFPLLIKSAFTFLDAHEIEARSIERLYDSVTSESSMSYGRELLAKQAASGIIGSPVWGNGIGSFDSFSGVYPHNIVLQLMYEGGALLAIPLLLLLLNGFVVMLDCRFRSEYRLFMLVLLCSGIIELFLSSHLWMSLFFWLFIGLGLLRHKFVAPRFTMPSYSYALSGRTVALRKRKRFVLFKKKKHE